MLPWTPDSSAPLLASVRDTSLAKLVRDEVLSMILGGEIGPGQRINEPDVASRLRVSRVPVREALRELESTGLVRSRKHVGVFVRTLQPKEVADLYDLRSALDGHAAWRAAVLPDPDRRLLVDRLAGLLREMRAQARRREVQRYYAGNLSFHWAIVEAVGNEHLVLSYRGIVQQLHLYRLKNLSRDVGMRASIAEHDGIVAALAAGDAERARRLSFSHVSDAHTRLVARLAGPAGAESS